MLSLITCRIQARRYRGYIAIDDVQFKTGSECQGHCNFDSGLCGFSNDGETDFDWKVVSTKRGLTSWDD